MAIATRQWCSQNRLLLLLLACGLVLRIGFSLTRPTDEASLANLPDQLEYRWIAQSMLRGEGIVFFDEGFQQPVHAYRMPGYPAFMAALGTQVVVVRCVQAVVDVSCALAVYLIAYGRFGRATALLAAGLVVCNPYLVFFSSTLLSETLFGALLIWGMLGLIGRGPLAWTAGVLALIAAVYVRPSAIGLPVLLTAVMPFVGPSMRWATGRQKLLLSIAGGMAVLALLVMALLPWALRNRAVVGQWVWTTTNGGITAYDGLNPQADGSSNQAHFRNWPALKRMTETERSTYLGSLAREFAVQHPQRVLELAVRKFGRLWSPVPLSAEFGSRSEYVVAGLTYAAPLMILTAIGLWRGKNGRAFKLYLLLPAVYFTLIHTATVGSLRYRVPADIPVTVIAAAGLTVVWKGLRRQSADSS